MDTVIVQYGHLKVCQIVIENAKDKNPTDDRQTPFYIAAELGHFDMCPFFIAFIIIILDWIISKQEKVSEQFHDDVKKCV